MRADRPQAAALLVQALLQAQAGIPPAGLAAGVPIHRDHQAPAAPGATLEVALEVLIQGATLAVALQALTPAEIQVAAPGVFIPRGQLVPAILAGIPAKGHRERTRVEVSLRRILVQAARPRVRRKARHSPM